LGKTVTVLLMQAVQRLRNADGVTVLCCMQDGWRRLTMTIRLRYCCGADDRLLRDDDGAHRVMMK
jgi:hypothetical protein